MWWDELALRARRGVGVFRYARTVRRFIMGLRLPVVRPFWAAVQLAVQLAASVFWWLAKFCYREPTFRARCARVGRRLILEREAPLIFGTGRIEIGDDVRIGGRNTWIVGLTVSESAELVIGDRTSVNFGTLLSIAKSIRIGNDVMIAANAQIYDNPSHPISPAARRAHQRLDLAEARPISIGDNVWIGANSIIIRSSIGENSIVAAGSVVTKPVPPNTLVGGNPARVIRELSDESGSVER
jgi:serine acetyltransferase